MSRDEPMPMEQAPELDPRAKAVQELALAERRVQSARWERDRAVRQVEKAEGELAEARTAAADALGVRESELAGLR